MPDKVDHYREMLDCISDGVYFVDPDRRVTFWNAGAQEISGYSPEEMVGHHCFDNRLRHIDETGVRMCGVNCPLKETLADGEGRSYHFYLHHREGHRLPVVVQSSALRDDEGNIVGATEIFRRDDEWIAAHLKLVELERLALTDPLTGVGNRRHFDSTLANWLSEWGRYGHRFGLLMIDLDHFKKINDSVGHERGDAALRVVASSLQSSMRGSDVVGRFGGDEFVALVRAETDDELRRVGERARFLVSSSGVDVAEDEAVTLAISVGGALVEAGDTAEWLCTRADAQLYLSKEQGRNQVTVGRRSVTGDSATVLV
ncbi:MAG: hypothetical protein QG622_1753 [Actinomycetota bacterium]|nr:hypothetical protein [Actinomycetota bacterium]